MNKIQLLNFEPGDDLVQFNFKEKKLVLINDYSNVKYIYFWEKWNHRLPTSRNNNNKMINSLFIFC